MTQVVRQSARNVLTTMMKDLGASWVLEKGLKSAFNHKSPKVREESLRTCREGLLNKYLPPQLDLLALLCIPI